MGNGSVHHHGGAAEHRTHGNSIVVWGAGVVVVGALLIMLGRDGYADSLRSPTLGVVSSCTHQCEECGDNLHKITSGPVNASSAHQESCNTGTCADHSCEALEAGLGELLPAVYLADGNGLKELLQEYPNTLSWNEERQAVQVTCSEGITIANIPLTRAQMRSLTE